MTFLEIVGAVTLAAIGIAIAWLLAVIVAAYFDMARAIGRLFYVRRRYNLGNLTVWQAVRYWHRCTWDAPTCWRIGGLEVPADPRKPITRQSDWPA